LLFFFFGTSGTLVLTLENNDLYNGTYGSKTSLKENILKQDVWQEFVIFFNVSKGCQIFVDGVNTTMPDEYVDFSTGTPTDIDSFKIETKYTSGEYYSFWFDNFLVNKIEGGFILDIFNRLAHLDNLQYSFDEGAKKSFTDKELFSFPEDGLHDIIIYGTDSYGDEYRSEFTIFTTGATFDVYTVTYPEYEEVISDWDEIDHVYGPDGAVVGGGTLEGALEDNDGEPYAYCNAAQQGGGTDDDYMEPNGDSGTNGWTTSPLYLESFLYLDIKDILEIIVKNIRNRFSLKFQDLQNETE